ncbi:MAG: hypothetical protein RLZZ444_2649 [Pseudomonadota bacterium]
MKLVARIAVISGTLGMLASCTTSKVTSVVPDSKPSAQELAALRATYGADATATDKPVTDANGKPVVETKPLDLATDKTVAMAYAMPAPRPDIQLAAADSQLNATLAAVENGATVASPVSLQETASLDAETATTEVIAAAVPTPADRSDAAITTALVADAPKTRSLDAFAAATTTSSKNQNLNVLISKYAALYDVPEHLVHHVVRRESNYNPGAVHRGNWGLMQIRYNTAKGLGYDGSASGLLDAETNLKYAVKYLRGAWIVAEKDAKKADWLYRTGYYYEAKRKRLLDRLY